MIPEVKMRISQIGKALVILTMVTLMLSVPVLTTSCSSNMSGAAATELATTLVPPVDLDVYLYANQQVPTVVPKSLTGAPVDISVQSVSIWGIVNSDTQYTLAGALTFTSSSDASAVFSQIPNTTNIYTKLSNNTIYFIKGSGGPAESIKNAIDNNNFKKYDDQNALAEVSKLPSGGTTNPGLIGVVKPTQAAVNLVKQYLDQNTANTINSVFSYAKPEIIALGVFGSQPLNLADLSQQVANNTIWNSDLGVVVAIDSAYPGFIFSPIANHVIANQGFSQVTIGNLSAFKDSVSLGNGTTIPVYLNINGNQVYATASGNDAYAQTLMTSINR